ncbi:MAG: DUF1848 domain-containing protein [Bacillota bacterium]
MIITASRRTDLPAFFGQWFMQRISEGYFYSTNPFNPKQVRRVSLSSTDVETIVFVSKNPQPFLHHLDELDQRGYHYYFQFTLNDYPTPIEPGVPAVEDRLETFKALSERIGPRRNIWRYDPIMLSSATPPSYHLERVERLASELQGSTTRLVVSFFDLYRKAEPRLKAMAAKHGITAIDSLAEPSTCLELAGGIRQIADRYGIEIVSCAEVIDLRQVGIKHGACIDAQLIKELSGVNCSTAKDRSQRPECGCAHAIDVGFYNTCRFGCVYCYANSSDRMIDRNLSLHSPDSPSMVGHPQVPDEESSEDNAPYSGQQLRLDEDIR